MRWITHTGRTRPILLVQAIHRSELLRRFLFVAGTPQCQPELIVHVGVFFGEFGALAQNLDGLWKSFFTKQHAAQIESSLKVLWIYLAGARQCSCCGVQLSCLRQKIAQSE